MLETPLEPLPEGVSPAEALKIKRDKVRRERKARKQRERRQRLKVDAIATDLLATSLKKAPLEASQGKMFKSLLLDRLLLIERGYTLSRAERIVELVIEKALSGEDEAIKLILDRVDGKVLAAESDSKPNAMSGLTILIGPGSHVTTVEAPVKPTEAAQLLREQNDDSQGVN